MSDILSDEDCEELVDDNFLFNKDFLEKKTGLKRAPKPPSSPKSPYLTSLNVNPRRAAVAAWRLPRASLGASREGTPGDREKGPGRAFSISNGYDYSPPMRAERAMSPELFRKNYRKQQRLLQSAANGFSGCDYRDKEDLHQEIIHLKKIIHEQTSDIRQMKAKMRRLEEDKTRRDRQIQELLDPTKGADFTRSLVDNKRGGSVVINGLKQRILKLEKHCREKESALSKLQSDLRTTNLEELNITVETYFEEIHRLRILLDGAEKRSAADCKTWRRQQRALNSTVQRLSERNSLLQQENQKLSEQLSIHPPAGPSGYKEWSKQRLQRRILELERRLEERQRPAPPPKRAVLLDKEVQTVASEMPSSAFTMATEAGISVATMTEVEEEKEEEGEGLGERLSRWKEERAGLQETLRRWEEERAQEKAERKRQEKEMEEWKAEWKAEQMAERDKENQQHRQEMEVLWIKLQTLEKEREQAVLSAGEHPPDKDEPEPRDSEEMEPGDKEETEPIDPDVVLLQSALRGHVYRVAQLKAAERTPHSDSDDQAEGELDLESLVLIQSALRGHVTRSRQLLQSPELLESLQQPTSALPPGEAGERPLLREEDSGEEEENPVDRAAAADSDDSDGIVSPSRPIRRPEDGDK